jgi:hypothetical protein
MLKPAEDQGAAKKSDFAKRTHGALAGRVEGIEQGQAEGMLRSLARMFDGDPAAARGQHQR